MNEQGVSLLLTCVVVIAFAWLLTAVIKQLSVRLNVVDEEGERTLHKGTIPRGGGLAIVLAVCVGHLILHHLDYPFSLPAGIYLTLSLVAATLGLLDDFFGLSVAPRLLVQIAIGLGFYLTIDSHPIVNPMWGALSVVCFVLFAINAANFMDGADGLLASQAITVAVCISLMFWTQADGVLSRHALVFAAATAGFLFWNWHPAKIFLGDVGSYFVGASLVALVLIAPEGAEISLIILFIPLFADAMFTLLRRALRGVKIWKAHREHVYQRLIMKGVSPSWISGYLTIILCVLFAPMSMAAILYVEWAPILLLISLIISAAIWGLLYKFSAE